MTQIVLKIVAIVTMFIDHLAAGLGDTMYPVITGTTYSVMRGIGRTAFPIFCFLITEGFYHTRNRRNYFLRLLLFCFVSEFPFDYIFNWYYGVDYWLYDSQNVFFTLALGLLMLIINDRIWEILKSRGVVAIILSAVIQGGMIYAFAEFADLLSTDYGRHGIFLLSMIFYIGRLGRFIGEKRKLQDPDRARFVFSALAIALWFALYDLKIGQINESAGFFAVILVAFYNGKKGPKLLPRWFFYVFYPTHLLLIGVAEHLINEQNLMNLLNSGY